MEVKNAFAGTLESGDILVQITPSEEESLQIDLDSTVEYQFGGQIRKVIKETLENLGVKKAHVKATDKGALDCRHSCARHRCRSQSHGQGCLGGLVLVPISLESILTEV